MSESISITASRVALISVWDKSGLRDLALQLWSSGFHIVSTGGTFKQLQQCWDDCKEQFPSFDTDTQPLSTVSDLTGFPEILSGRVKTLHPKIHGALLARRDQQKHQLELLQHQIPSIDLVVCNLYPFHTAVKNTNLFEAQELIDIGGVTLIRAAAKNFDQVLVVTDPSEYSGLITRLKDGTADEFEWRRQLALQAFLQTTHYDAQIANYLANYQPNNTNNNNNNNNILKAPQTVVKVYQKTRDLKYGTNPQQQPAAVYRQLAEVAEPKEEAITVVNGNPGFINYLDAYYAWGLVQEVAQALETPVAASFKHNSPAGVGIGEPELSSFQQDLYGLTPQQAESPLARAFIRARQGDPKSSFGDMIGLSHRCDLTTARLIAREVSDGVIAPGYEQEALEVLMKKRGGNYLILQGNPVKNESLRFRDLDGGMALAQPPNRGRVNINCKIDHSSSSSLPPEAIRDMILANLALKYAQSNTVCIASNGQVIGLAAGQQSRVDCVKLAVSKAHLWCLRHLPEIHQQLNFQNHIKRQERVNAVISYLEGSQPLTDDDPGYQAWSDLFQENQPPTPLTREELAQCQLAAIQSAQETSPICLASDAFFPFRDSLDQAARSGVQYVIQPGGSRNDPEVERAAKEHGMTMIMSNVRMFTH